LRLLMLERFAQPRPSFREIMGSLRGHHFANALVSFLFACTGPVALILTVGIAGGLKPAEIASWVSLAFMLGAVITFTMSWLYRQPLAMAWTIPGTAIVGAGLLKFPYAEIVGAYVVTGALMLALGLSGAFRKIMDWMPQPIVMAMVAGLFLKFGILAIDGFDKAPIVAVAATAGFVLFSLVRPLGRFVPPVVAALAAGAIAIAVLGGFAPREGASGLIADPIFFVPKFSEAALLDLVLPLAISVVVLQYAQGIGILRMKRHDPPANMITSVCGAGTIVFGLFGAVCTCLTGPVNAILSSSGEVRNHYLGAFIWAGFAFLFGLFAPGIIALALAVPDAFIYVIGGLAMLRVLQQSLAAAFGGKFTAGAVVCMTVTVTELIPEARFALLGIGAPFWGLVFGILASLLLEPGDFRKPAAALEPAATPAPDRAPVPARAALEPEPEKASPSSESSGEPDRSERPRPPVPDWALEPDKKPEPERAAAAAEAAVEQADGKAIEAAAPASPPVEDAVTEQIAPFAPPEGEAAKEGPGAAAEDEAEEPVKDQPAAEPPPRVPYDNVSITEAVTKQLSPFTAPERTEAQEPEAEAAQAESAARIASASEAPGEPAPLAKQAKPNRPKREKKPPA
jgi:benzoate membrane transport protein